MNTDLLSKLICEQALRNMDSAAVSKVIASQYSEAIPSDQAQAIIDVTVRLSITTSVRLTLSALDQLGVLPDISESDLRKLLFRPL